MDVRNRMKRVCAERRRGQGEGRGCWMGAYKKAAGSPGLHLSLPAAGIRDIPDSLSDVIHVGSLFLPFAVF